VFESAKYLILAVLTCLCLTGSTNEYENGSPVSSNGISLGVKIGILPTGGLQQTALVHYRRGRRTSIQPVTRERLIKVGAGKWPAPKTMYFHDYFADYDINVFGTDSTAAFDINAALDSLWKVRFSAHPLKGGKGKGWSQGEYRPTEKQRAYIYNRYGVRGYDQDYFADSSFFKLIKDVMNRDWIEHYKSLR